jgi:hypothetical protein
MDSVFTRHRAVRELSLAYQYATASLPSLDQLLPVAGKLGRDRGCATLAVACSVLRGIGLPLRAEPAIRPFTASPLPWNTYTALDAPVLDGGWLLAAPICALLGAFVGFAWAVSATGRTWGVILYAVQGTATLFASIQANFFISHYLAAILLALFALRLARVPFGGRLTSRWLPAR